MSPLCLVSLPLAAISLGPWTPSTPRKKLGAKIWSSRAVLRLLTNQTYAGHRPDGAPGRHAPIISAELFSKVQALIDGRRTRVR